MVRWVKAGEIMVKRLHERGAYRSVGAALEVANRAGVLKTVVNRVIMNRNIKYHDWRKLAVFLGIPV